jgi:hypothetical protein
MEKKRKAYTQITKLLDLKMYGVIILIGLRKTGKTKILTQLAEQRDGHYVDFRNSYDGEAAEQEYKNIFKTENNLILLDEIGYLPDFDVYLGALESDIKNSGKQVVITSSSYGTLKQLSSEKLGGGRSCIVELFPLDFEEYLYFSGKIADYGADYEPSAEDISDYYRLKDVPPGMDFIIDRKYMEDTFDDAEAARYNQYGGERNISLTKEQYAAALDVIAYSLNVPATMRKFQNRTVGVQEFGAASGIDFSRSLIGIAKQIVQGTAGLIVGDTDIPALSHIIQALYHNGFLFADLTASETDRQNPDLIHHDFNLVRTFNDLEQQLKKYNFSVISPLLYTRLLIDIEGAAHMVYTNDSLDGELYELAVKSEVVYREGYTRNHHSYKYQTGKIQVDVYHPKELLLETTVRRKTDSEHNVDKVLKERKLIRVLTREEGYKYTYTGVFHKVSYPLALLFLSNRKIYKWDSNKATDNNDFAYELKFTD